MTYQTVLAALADPTRRRMFERLRRGQRSVGEIAAGLPVSRPAVSQHLRVLREAGLVTERRQGTRRLYDIDLAGLDDLRAYLDGFWGDAREALRAAATSQPATEAPMADMPDPATLEPLRKSVIVPLTAMSAYLLFTEGIATWWPLASHSVGGDQAASCAFEPRLGGRIYETLRTGEEHVWGTVSVWQPPHRLVFTWHPGRGPETAQEIEIRFSPAADGTRVELEFRGWERLGSRATELRGNYDKGWEFVLIEKFVAAAGKPSKT
ncbi:MAG: metalloregulator ArsR/SmtB family transcription factor [Dongiaceae bacterium]